MKICIRTGKIISILLVMDGSIDLYFGPKLLDNAAKSNWTKTVPDVGWLYILPFLCPNATLF